jgi:hypothetical protein
MRGLDIPPKPCDFLFTNIFRDLAMHNKLAVDNNLLPTPRTNIIYGKMKELNFSVWFATSIYSIRSPFFSKTTKDILKC